MILTVCRSAALLSLVLCLAAGEMLAQQCTQCDPSSEPLCPGHPPHLVDPSTCTCNGLPPGSPIILDLDGRGFHLTDAPHGVQFDINGDHRLESISWTELGSNNGFLVLDRNQNGLIDSGTEMFGNFTQQPASDSPNGYIALAQYDNVALGGNENGIIDEGDAIYDQLRLWIDRNHDGISQPEELITLQAAGVKSISLDYGPSGRKDAFGNQFRFRSKIEPLPDAKVGTWSFDVFLTLLPN